jgi:hypothetical protein
VTAYLQSALSQPLNSRHSRWARFLARPLRPFHFVFQHREIEEPGDLLLVSRHIFRAQALTGKSGRVHCRTEQERVLAHPNRNLRPPNRLAGFVFHNDGKIAFTDLLDPRFGGFAPCGVRLAARISDLGERQVGNLLGGAVIDEFDTADLHDLFTHSERKENLGLPFVISPRKREGELHLLP